MAETNGSGQMRRVSFNKKIEKKKKKRIMKEK